ncbi:serine/threonine protein phosphatase PrpC [Bradyrhizobium sp. AZCC 1610]
MNLGSIGDRILTGDMDAPVVMTAPIDSCLLMIADGMGGHAHGAMASRAVLDYLVAAVDRLSNPASCTEVIEEANQHLFKLMHEHEEALGMGTTLLGTLLTADQVVRFNVGDSRCYLFSARQLVQLSYDDVPEGENNHFGRRRSHALTQALGGSSFPVAIKPPHLRRLAACTRRDPAPLQRRPRRYGHQSDHQLHVEDGQRPSSICA